MLQGFNDREFITFFFPLIHLFSILADSYSFKRDTMENFVDIVNLIKSYIWSFPLLILLIGVGLYLTILLGAIQFRYLGEGIKFSLSKQDTQSKGDITHFEALMTSLAGAIGTGNIVGIATAVTAGGLGALFWMWVTALLGMATRYAEAFLAVKYRITDERGEMSGGPMYYIERGLGWKWMAILFAIFGSIAAVGTGNMVQANSISDVIAPMFSLEPWVVGVIVAVITGLVLIGGVKSIGHVAGVLVPIMASLYVFGGLIILIINFNHIPGAISSIIADAFTGRSICGGVAGGGFILAVQMGVSRGVFSNESGLGISSIAAAAAKTDNPGRQAMVAMTGTFFSTMIVCTITGLVLAVTQCFGNSDSNGTILNGTALAIASFESGFTGGGWIVKIGLILFAYSTIIGWAYYGEKCFEYLFGERVIWLYRVLYTALIIPGAALDLEVVWSLADSMNGLMVIPNLIALIFLAKIVKRETDEFKLQIKREES
jgi:AGCS family alanine or glycine:cation symporter